MGGHNRPGLLKGSHLLRRDLLLDHLLLLRGRRLLGLWNLAASRLRQRRLPLRRGPRLGSLWKRGSAVRLPLLLENADVSDLTLALSFFVAFFAGVAFKAALVPFFFAGVAAAFFTVLAAVFFFASVAFALAVFFSAFFSCFFFSFLSVLMTSSRLQR